MCHWTARRYFQGSEARAGWLRTCALPLALWTLASVGCRQIAIPQLPREIAAVAAAHMRSTFVPSVPVQPTPLQAAPAQPAPLQRAVAAPVLAPAEGGTTQPPPVAPTGTILASHEESEIRFVPETPYLRDPLGEGPTAEELPPPAEVSPQDRQAGDGELPEGVPLRIEDCRAAALEGNLDLRITQFDPRITSERVREEKWRFEPFFSGTFSHNRVDPPPGSLSFGAPRAVDDLRPSFNFPLPTGGTVSLVDTHNRVDFLPGPRFADVTSGVSLTQPLLRDGWFPVNLAPIRVARLENATADANVRLTSIFVLAAVEQIYWQLYGAQQQVDIAQRQLTLAQQQLTIARRLADARVLPAIETLRAESGVALRREAQIVAETNVRLQSRALKQAMQRADLPVESAGVILPATRPSPVETHLDRPALVAFALENRVELEQNGYALDINDQTIVAAANGVLPSLQLEFFSRLLGTGGSFSAAEAQLQTADFDDVFVGLTAEVPLAGNQSARGRLRQAKWVKSRTLVERRQIKVAVAKEVYDAVDRLEQDWQRIVAARKAVDAARRTYEAERRLWQLGQRAGDLVLDAALRLATAETQEVLAIVDYMTSRAQLALATGSMLGYGGVEWVADR